MSWPVSDQRGGPARGGSCGADPIGAGGQRPLHVLLATARYLPEPGGTEIHTREVARRLAQRGAEVTIATTVRYPSFARERRDGDVRVLRVRAWPPNRDYYLAPGIVRAILKSRPDIVHCQGYHTLVAPLVMVTALRAGIPYLVTLHSGGHSSELRHRLRPLQAWALRPLLSRARRLVAVSKFEADLFAHRLLLPREAFQVIPGGVDLPPMPASPIPSGPPLVMSVGRVESYKGHQRVMEALPALRLARPEVQLRVVGSGVYEDQLQRLAQRLDIADIVEIGPVAADDREGLAGLLRRASVVASMSEYESQGLATQEALALGKPLVVAQETALGELARYPNVRALPQHASSDAVAAAILELLDAQPAEPPQLPTWDECADALLALYQETLGGRG